ncbi:gp62 [Mycobacterium phage Che9c]|uniref:Uncharacterized protein n=1 Tax=Mycobacterium phage Che9c TaxID=2907832 RepID=Q854T8_9CAUD|nr:gp62 [Mycobacterium phage Che9c]AAN12620.1 hypothetical protein PBI_CHE9C_62 [Mycobacterium phage Che9c]
MTRPPTYHYAEADKLVAEIQTYDPAAAGRVPAIAFKLRLAELHAQLAQSPWWPGLEAECRYTEVVTDLDGRTVHQWPAPAVETRLTKDDLL